MQLKYEQISQEENQASPLGAVGRKGLRCRKKALSGSPITFLKQNRKYSRVRWISNANEKSTCNYAHVFGKGQKKCGKKEYVFFAPPEKWKQKNISF